MQHKVALGAQPLQWLIRQYLSHVLEDRVDRIASADRNPMRMQQGLSGDHVFEHRPSKARAAVVYGVCFSHGVILSIPLGHFLSRDNSAPALSPRY